MHIPSNKLNGTGLRRIVKAAECSFKGLKAAWLYESAFRQELLLCAFLVPCSFLLKQSSLHWLALTISLLFLLFAEIVNSALEALADSISLEHHPLIGRAKDMGSAGVFIAMTVVGLIWGEALWRYIV
jgi:diacylglycerol kinase (ATP)